MDEDDQPEASDSEVAPRPEASNGPAGPTSEQVAEYLANRDEVEQKLVAFREWQETASAVLAKTREAPPPPVFPRLDKDGTVKVTRPYSLHTWVGDKERILALQKLLEDALEKAHDAAAAALRSSDPDDAVPRLTFDLERLADDYRLRVEVTGRGGRWTREGDLSAIFDDVELDEVETITMSNRELFGRGDVEVRVTFSRSRGDFRTPRGVDVKVSGHDRAWVTSLYDSIVEKLSRGRPGWAFATTKWFSVLTFIVLYVGGGTALLALIPGRAR